MLALSVVDMQIYLIQAALQLEKPQPSIASEPQPIQDSCAPESLSIEQVMDTVVQELGKVWLSQPCP